MAWNDNFYSFYDIHVLVCVGVDVHCFHNPVTLWSVVHNY